MISLKDAQKNQFDKSTRAELRAYAKELGIEDNLPDNADAKTIKRAVCNALGIVLNSEGRSNPRPVVNTSQGGDKIFPSYNLTPSGIWGGRRHRLSLPRPEGNTIAKAEGYAWNGKHTYYIPFDEVDAVPEPIYQIIVTNKRRRVRAERPEGGEVGELTTVWSFDSMPFSYFGVDEVTKDCAGSLLEWYQSRGSEWFTKLTPRQLQQVAQKLEVPNRENMGEKMPPRVLSDEELLGRVYQFLYGYPDAVVEPNDAIRA